MQKLGQASAGIPRAHRFVLASEHDEKSLSIFDLCVLRKKFHDLAGQVVQGQAAQAAAEAQLVFSAGVAAAAAVAGAASGHMKVVPESMVTSKLKEEKAEVFGSTAVRRKETVTTGAVSPCAASEVLATAW
eukprot:CAMPEP_0206615930 /NCGR_PEP_ID=MMETSP0325_2-20121206/58632_1 /ASSEMBLY_ACC=CAM_ASM_000347 /TAXON_ID=2866 /ORGANISM="Crypthecodinium cohnii, Strain Seligo" /LENGTH=130 /DNA_ID=CAMNT_0054137415 /DNA_START=173 /DNA_END=563 /DNA_ORIENTATION=-